MYVHLSLGVGERTRKEAEDFARSKSEEGTKMGRLAVVGLGYVYSLIEEVYSGFEAQKCSNCGCSVQDSIYFEAESNGRQIPDLSSFGCINWKVGQ